MPRQKLTCALLSVTLGLLAVTAACTAGGGAPAAAPLAGPSAATPGTSAVPSGTTPVAPEEASRPSAEVAPSPSASAPAGASTGAPSTAGDAAAGSEPATGAPAAASALPEVTVAHLGLHVGGGPNDERTKRPILNAIGERFPELRTCYQKIARPGSEGSYGIDLVLSVAGGKAEGRSERTKLGGDEFRACVRDLLVTTTYPPMKRPTTVSYSLMFRLR